MPSSNTNMKGVAIIVLIGTSLAAVWIHLVGLPSALSYYMPAISKPMGSKTTTSALADLALAKVLKDAAPIFGYYDDSDGNGNVQTEMSTWMSQWPDETMLVHMNIPGVHDAATWNYSRSTQEALKGVVELVSHDHQPNDWFRCQQRSIVSMLNAGIRAFDLRYAQDVTNSTLVFWHGRALQSQTATVDAVMFGFYRWLEDHPSETLMLSFQYEGKKVVQNVDSSDVQLQLYETLTSLAAQRYIHQDRDVLGTLGNARGKIILFRRFDLDLLPQTYEDSIPGIHFSPKRWTANSPSIQLVYNELANRGERTEEGTAYIEDYYHPVFLTATSTLAENIDIKYNATEAHLRLAASDAHPNGLFWAFASGTNTNNEPEAITPKLMALGDAGTGTDGVNQRLLKSVLNDETMKGKRLGIIMFDFYEQPTSELVEAFLALRQP